MKGTTHGLLALLREKDSEIRTYAIEQLIACMPNDWPLIADQLPIITKLAKLQEFPAHQKASKLASITAYYDGNSEVALEYALLSGELFQVSVNDEYTQKVISYAFQKYIWCKQTQTEISPAHHELVVRCINNLLKKRKYSQVLTLAIETHLLDSVKVALESSPPLASGAIRLCLESVTDNSYRRELLDILVVFLRSQSDKFQLSQIYLALEDSKNAAILLSNLCSSTEEDDILMGHQIAFELAENAHQQFRKQVIDSLPDELHVVKSILTREKLLAFYLDFLFKRNHNDIQILISLKDQLETAKSVIHTSVVIAYSFMFAGTADDNFFRLNVSWFITARKWSQFTTAAAIGVIHIGHLSDVLIVLGSFLNQEAPEHVTGGALYALGLIYVNFSWSLDIIELVAHHLKNSPSHVVQHGACLALGLISMGSRNSEHYQLLLQVLSKDQPEPGEAAGYALGMVMLGSGDAGTVETMIGLATFTEHEKIMRGLAMGLAFVMYGRGAEARPVIERLLASRNALMRESAAWITALANVGTASNEALQRLLHIAVSDVNENVRRAAVIGVGFVLSRRPKEVPSMVNLLAKSYHQHVRMGAALAIGISCAGTGSKEAIDVLRPLLTDNEDTVRQNAMIAMAMVMMQQSDEKVPYAKEFRAFLRSNITRKRSEMITFGMCCAWGILNAGGRNVVISCNSLRGENSVSATVGLAMFCNHFFWHPLALMLPLSFHPTAIIGLDKNLAAVDWEVKSAAPPSTYSYPPPFAAESEAMHAAPAPVALSITSRTRTLRPPVEPEKKKEEEPKTEEEPEFEIIPNMSRVTLSQLKHIEIIDGQRYKPVIGKVTHGFIMLKENQ